MCVRFRRCRLLLSLQDSSEGTTVDVIILPPYQYLSRGLCVSVCRYSYVCMYICHIHADVCARGGEFISRCLFFLCPLSYSRPGHGHPDTLSLAFGLAHTHKPTHRWLLHLSGICSHLAPFCRLSARDTISLDTVPLYLISITFFDVHDTFK